MSFTSIKRIIPQSIQQAGIQKQVTAARVIEESLATLLALWGEEKTAYASVVSFKDGQLKWQITSPTALMELKTWEVRLQNEINRRLGSKVILRMVFLTKGF